MTRFLYIPTKDLQTKYIWIPYHIEQNGSLKFFVNKSNELTSIEYTELTNPINEILQYE